MIVDVHTHVPSHRDSIPPDEMRTETTMRSGETVQLTNTIDDYLRAIEPLDKAFLFGIASRPWKDWSPLEQSNDWPPPLNQNDAAADVASHAPGKVIPFMSLHPLDPNVNDEYDRAIGELGCKGIKLGPNYQDFDPLGSEAFRLFARLEHDGLPIVFHQGTSPFWDAPLAYAHPLTTDRIAMAFPRLKMVVAHLGHPWQTDCLAIVRKHPNVWADVSAQFYRPWSFWNAMQLFHEWGVTEKILFASDWPVTQPQDNIDHLRGLNEFAAEHNLPGIPEDEIEGIINRDALDILGVE